MSGVLVATGGHAADSHSQGGKTPLQCVTVKPANVSRLQWIVCHDGELPEAMWLGQVGVMSTRRWGRVAWISEVAGEWGVHVLSGLGCWGEIRKRGTQRCGHL